MSDNRPEFVERLINGRFIAALSTLMPDGSPHLTAVWYAFVEGKLYVATGSGSRKARNAAARPQVGLMIDTREPGIEQGLAVAGRAEVLTGAAAVPYREIVQARYLTPAALADPEVGPVFATYDDAVIQLAPERWTWWDIAASNRRKFGDKFSVAGGYLYPLDAC